MSASISPGSPQKGHSTTLSVCVCMEECLAVEIAWSELKSHS
jgi:hypothetical protein